MTDKEILDWLQDNLLEFRQDTDSSYKMCSVEGEYYSGTSLRECVEAAVKELK